jgi:raffinose/stachyose/melibiose transport system substrate-binding protein
MEAYMKRALTLIVVLAFICAGTMLFAGGQKEAEAEGPVTIKYMTYHVGADPAADLEKMLIEKYNKKFEGKYVLSVEEIPGDHAYTEKLKTLVVSTEMPDVWEGKEPDFNYKAWKAGKAMDLTPYLKSDSFLKSRFTTATIEIQKRDWEGQVPWFSFREPTEWAYFYNKDLFAKAGIREPARTWEDFWTQCDKLKAIGVYPIAMQTADNAWLSSHWLMALIATSGPEGEKFVTTPDPANYEVPVFIEAIRTLQKMLQEYAQPDAVGANYNLGAAAFHAEKAAMISNGPWQINNFKDPDTVPAGFIDKVGWTLFPGGVYIGGTSRVTGGLAVNPERGEEVIKGSIELLKMMQEDWFAEESFVQLGHRPSGYDLPEKVFKDSPLMGVWEKEKKAHTRKNKITLLCLGDMFHRTVADAMQNYLPLLANGEMTPEEFAAKMNKIAAQQ